MKYFFGSSIKRTAEGGTIASKSVKEEIRQIIGTEKPRNPSAIVRLLIT